MSKLKPDNRDDNFDVIEDSEYPIKCQWKADCTRTATYIHVTTQTPACHKHVGGHKAGHKASQVSKAKRIAEADAMLASMKDSQRLCNQLNRLDTGIRFSFHGSLVTMDVGSAELLRDTLAKGLVASADLCHSDPVPGATKEAHDNPDSATTAS